MIKLKLAHKTVFLVAALAALVWAGQNIGTEITAAPVAPLIKNPYAKIDLEAKAAVVYDPDKNEILYSHNAYAPMPLASVTKIMTALAAYEGASPWQEITISPEILRAEGDSGLRRDERWRLADLIEFTLITSSNDGATALAAAGQTNFISKMNALAQQLGLEQTNFNNPTGLDLPTGEGGAYGSAFDVAKLMGYVLTNHPEILSATSQASWSVRSDSQLNHFASNTNTLARALPGLFASKTGYTDAAGGNLAVAVDLGLREPVIVVVLGSSEAGRFRDVNQLLTATSQLFNQR